MNQQHKQNIFEKTWKNLSFPNVVMCWGVFPALCTMFAVLITSLPIKIDSGLFSDFIIALVLYSTIYVGISLSIFVIIKETISGIIWIRNNEDNRISHIAASSVLDDAHLTQMAKDIERKLLNLFKGKPNPQIQELEDRYNRELSEKDEKLQQQQEEINELKKNNDRISKLENQVGAILKKQTHSSKNDDNVEDIEKYNNIEYRD